MTYDAQKVKPGREPVFIAELYLTRCSLTYGTSPCTAAVGTTGAQKCFNTQGTCQDTDNFDADNTVPLRFASREVLGLQASGEPPVFPTLLGVSTAPTKLDPGKGLGIRASVTVSVQNHTWTDFFTDPYVSGRSYDPNLQGTFWGRLIARNPYYEGRRLDVLTGYLDDDGKYNAANFQRRTYIIFRVSGPDKSGKVSITAKDPLRSADNDRAQCPAVSVGQLDSDINDSVTTIPIDGSLTPYSDAYTAGQLYVRIGAEVMKQTSAPGSGNLTVSRATVPTYYTRTPPADEHKEGDTVQVCHEFNGVRVDEIIQELLEDFANVDSSFIPFSSWEAVADDWLSSFDFYRLITKPIGVKDLLIELTKHLVLLWWDDREQEIKLDAVRPLDVSGAFSVGDDDDILAGSVTSTYDVVNRISQFWVYFGSKDPVDTDKKAENFNEVYALIDADAETPDQYGSRKIKELWSEWLPKSRRDIAIEISSRMIVEFRNTKRVISLSLDPKNDDAWTGDVLEVTTRYVEDVNGAADVGFYRVLEVKEQLSNKSGAIYKYIAERSDFGGRCAIIAPTEDPVGTPFPDYLLASTAQRAYGFICDTTTEQMSDGDPPYLIC